MNEMSNKAITYLLLEKLGKDESSICFVADRLGHDRRYAIDCSKVQQDLGRSPTYNFEQGIENTINWYKQERKVKAQI